MSVDPDAVFTTLLAELVAPIGFGMLGIVAAGLMGAILSSIDSMMNSAATIVTFDVYRRYFHPAATERQLIWVGRICILLFVVGGTLMALLTMDPNSKDNFFLSLTSYQSKLVVGIVVAFVMGMLWPRTTAAGGLAALLSGVFFGFTVPIAYEQFCAWNSILVPTFGAKLNFMHTALVNAVLSTCVCVMVSVLTPHNAEKATFTWTGLAIFTPAIQWFFFAMLGISIVVYVSLGLAVYWQQLEPMYAGWVAASWTLFAFALAAKGRLRRARQPLFPNLISNDLFLAGILAATAVYMLYHFA